MVGVGYSPREKVDPLTLMGGTDRGRAEQIPLCIVPEAGQSTEDGPESVSNKSRDVLKKDPSGLNLPKHALDVRPEPSLVVGTLPLTRDAERLARESRRHEIHDATPWSTVEGREIVPDRSPTHGRFFHPCHESGRGVAFPLDVAHTMVFGYGELEAKLEPSNPGT